MVSHSDDFKLSQKIRMQGNDHAKGNSFKMPKGMHWWNNGKTETRAVERPEGFEKGRLKTSNQ